MNAMACSFMAAVLSRNTLVQLDRFHPTTWWSDVSATEATIIHYLGVMPAILLGLEPGPNDRGHKVRFGFGANVEPVHHAAFDRGLGNDRDRCRSDDLRKSRATPCRHALYRPPQGV
jgi:hypothetical protein